MSWYVPGQIDGGRHPPHSSLLDGPEAHIRREGDAYDEANKPTTDPKSAKPNPDSIGAK